MIQASTHKTVKKRKPVRRRTGRRPKPKNQAFGTSKLEERFARNILDKLGVEYVYQFEAKSIGRYYDFAIISHRILIEVDGDYYHAKGLDFKDMSPMQKHNHRVDEYKNTWANLNSWKLIRIWEEDINKHPEQVLAMLKGYIDGIQVKLDRKEATRLKGHVQPTVEKRKKTTITSKTIRSNERDNNRAATGRSSQTARKGVGGTRPTRRN